MKPTLRAMLSAYKRWISPALPAACRFVPTCSEYAMQAVEQHGALRGGMLGGWRLLRCHPLGRSGYDPVPVKFWKKDTASTLGGEDFASGHDPSAGSGQAFSRAERRC
jgi:putative membrane protein insertion efficiency factor